MIQSKLRLGVLDQSPIPVGGTAAGALQETLELARLAETLGFERYWVAEHHGAPGFAGTAPEILIARIAGLTSRIRVGSAGVMLSHYAPLKVAETFRILEAFYPGRIDLGIGRAPGSDQRTAYALEPGGPYDIAEFPGKIADLIGFLGNSLPADHPFRSILVQPAGPTLPEMWMLGSSDQSAAYAAMFGLPFAFAHFISGHGGEEACAAYRANYRPSPAYPSPRTALAVFAICAETHEEAARLASSRELWRLRVERGELAPIPSPEEALAYDYSDLERARIARTRARQIVGNPQSVRMKIEALATAHGSEEISIVTITFDPIARRRSYELLAREFALS
ncbi:MAG: MsnO8 family LLM class oxidoreductase [Alphaproteobacteria bacterium]|nr:MsnO8 family LLM class oxidoreductase [Alphaproteobacteria bacterium]